MTVLCVSADLIHNPNVLSITVLYSNLVFEEEYGTSVSALRLLTPRKILMVLAHVVPVVPQGMFSVIILKLPLP